MFLDATAAAAVIDRIVHHATVLTTNGDSYRLKAAQRNQTAHARKKTLGTRQRGPFSRCHKVPFLLATTKNALRLRYMRIGY